LANFSTKISSLNDSFPLSMWLRCAIPILILYLSFKASRERTREIESDPPDTATRTISLFLTIEKSSIVLVMVLKKKVSLEEFEYLEL